MFDSDFLESISQQIIAGLLLSLCSLVIYLVWRSLRRRHRVREALSIEVAQFSDDFWRIAFPKELPSLGRIDGIQIPARDAYGEGLARGGVDIETTKLRIRLRVIEDAVVVVREIKVLVIRNEPIRGVSLSCASAGSNEDTILMVDLDCANPALVKAQEKDWKFIPVEEIPFFSRNTISVSRQDPQEIIVIGRTQNHFVEWSFDVTYESEGIIEHKAVNLDGQPFRTTGTPESDFLSKFEWAWDLDHQIIPRRNWEDS